MKDTDWYIFSLKKYAFPPRNCGVSGQLLVHPGQNPLEKTGFWSIPGRSMLCSSAYEWMKIPQNFTNWHINRINRRHTLGHGYIALHLSHSIGMFVTNQGRAAFDMLSFCGQITPWTTILITSRTPLKPHPNFWHNPRHSSASFVAVKNLI